jgi:polysaccharide deacetylase 2 family uncharacterized protein YibQ
MWDSIDLISSNLKLQIFIRDGLSDEEIAKRLAEQISVTVGNRHAILDYLLNYLCEEINRVR